MKNMISLLLLCSCGFAQTAYAPSSVLCGPLDTTCFFINEEFLPGSTSTNNVGLYGWALHNVGSGTCAAFAAAGSFPALGIEQLNAGSTAGYGCNMALDNGSVAPFGQLLSTWGWDSYWGFGLASSASANSLRIGYLPPGTTTVLPATFWGVRADASLKSISSAVCNDAGNKCGLTTITAGCSAGSGTVTGTIPGGSANFSVTCTGTNAIANGTSITISGTNLGYNSTGSPTVGLATGGTATYTGNVTMTPTLGAGGTGADVDFMLCASASTIEYCADSTIALDTSLHKVRIRWISSSEIGMTFYNAAGTASGSEVTFCPSACTVTTTLSTFSPAPAASITTQTSANRTLSLDFFKFLATGLTR